MAKAKAPIHASPAGIAVFPKLNEPDYEFNPGGVWSSKLKYNLDDEGTQELWDWLEERHAAAYEAYIASKVTSETPVPKGMYKTAALAKKKIPVADKPHVMLEDDDGEPTNEFTVNFKRVYHVITKDKREFYFTPKFFDAANKRIKNVPQIWGGSKLKVTYNCNDWGTPKLGGGISLRLVNVQIIDLVNADNGDGGDSGFGEEEGYTNEDDFDSGSTPTPQAGDSGADAGDDSDDDGTGDF